MSGATIKSITIHEPSVTLFTIWTREINHGRTTSRAQNIPTAYNIKILYAVFKSLFLFKLKESWSHKLALHSRQISNSIINYAAPLWSPQDSQPSYRNTPNYLRDTSRRDWCWRIAMYILMRSTHNYSINFSFILKINHCCRVRW